MSDLMNWIENREMDSVYADRFTEIREELERLRYNIQEHQSLDGLQQMEIERLQQIIAAYYDGWPEPWAECMDGFEMQEFAEKHGIMDRLERTVPCEEGCRCAEYYGEGDECECFVLRPEFRVKAALKGVDSNE